MGPGSLLQFLLFPPSSRHPLTRDNPTVGRHITREHNSIIPHGFKGTSRRTARAEPFQACTHVVATILSIFVAAGQRANKSHLKVVSPRDAFSDPIPRIARWADPSLVISCRRIPVAASDNPGSKAPSSRSGPFSVGLAGRDKDEGAGAQGGRGQAGTGSPAPGQHLGSAVPGGRRSTSGGRAGSGRPGTAITATRVAIIDAPRAVPAEDVL